MDIDVVVVLKIVLSGCYGYRCSCSFDDWFFFFFFFLSFY